MAKSSASRKKGDRADEEREDEKPEEETPEEENGPPSWLERVATLISALLVAGMLGVLIRDSTHEDTPPAFETVAGRPETSGKSVRVPVEIRNTGDEAAHNIQVHIELRAADSVLAESDLTVDWLAGRSKHDVVGFFEAPTLPFTAHAEVRGYTEP
jgi:uncharacterized protein (TIGR02588 family)